MMTDARADAVEAAVDWMVYEDSLPRNHASQFVHGILNAYLASMADAGWVMVPKTATDKIARAGRDEMGSELMAPSAALMALAYDAMVHAAMLADPPPKR